MSLVPDYVQEDKCCFTYCGDDICDCTARKIFDALPRTDEQWMRLALEMIASGAASDPQDIARQCLTKIKQ